MLWALGLFPGTWSGVFSLFLVFYLAVWYILSVSFCFSLKYTIWPLPALRPQLLCHFLPSLIASAKPPSFTGYPPVHSSLLYICFHLSTLANVICLFMYQHTLVLLRSGDRSHHCPDWLRTCYLDQSGLKCVSVFSLNFPNATYTLQSPSISFHSNFHKGKDKLTLSVINFPNCALIVLWVDIRLPPQSV